jgi:hypothetical protein
MKDEPRDSNGGGAAGGRVSPPGGASLTELSRTAGFLSRLIGPGNCIIGSANGAPWEPVRDIRPGSRNTAPAARITRLAIYTILPEIPTILPEIPNVLPEFRSTGIAGSNISAASRIIQFASPTFLPAG